MTNFWKKLFENDASEEEEHEASVIRFSGIKTCDNFGRSLSNYLKQFPSAELDAVLPALYELGCSSHPVDDWHHFKKIVRSDLEPNVGCHGVNRCVWQPTSRDSLGQKSAYMGRTCLSYQIIKWHDKR